MASHHRLNAGLTVAAFALSAIGTVIVLLLLASTGPFNQENAPPLLWSIVLWGMVAIGTWVVLLRLVVLLLVPLAGFLYRRSAGEAGEGAAGEEGAAPGAGEAGPAESSQ